MKEFWTIKTRKISHDAPQAQNISNHGISPELNLLLIILIKN